MNRKFGFLTLAILASVAQRGSLALADPPPDPTSDLSKMYARMDDSAGHKNIDACMSVISPNLILIGLDGSVEDSDGQRNHLLQVFAEFDTLTVVTKIEHCDYTANTATVVITQHVKAIPPTVDGEKPVVLEGDISAREAWTKETDGWKLDIAQTLSGGRMTQDN